jgi:tellurite resistance protein TerC
VALSFLFNGLFWWNNTTGSTEIANSHLSFDRLPDWKSLAVDNIFVFLLDLHSLCGATAFQKRVLIGIIGAIVLRTVMILVLEAGCWLSSTGCCMSSARSITTGIKMWWAAGKEPNLDDNPALKLLRRLLPVSKNYDCGESSGPSRTAKNRDAAVHGGA